MRDDACLECVLNAAAWTFEDSTRAAADAQIRNMLQALYALHWHPPEVPDVVRVDEQTVAPREDWFEGAWKRAKYEALARWAPRDRAVMDVNLGIRNISLANNHAPFTARSLVDGLSTIPFTLGTVGHVFYGAQWKFPTEFFKTPGFAGAHGRFGLGAVFRGDGHNAVVSRRWLTHGPWRVLRGANDTTFVQFYDLGASSPDIALAQAKDGYARLAPTYDGTTGFVWFDETPGDQLPKDAVYDAKTQTTWILANDRSVDANEMYWVALERFNGTVKPSSMYRTVKASAYLFSTEARAKAHLHELWLRGHQVWYGRGTERVRIDQTYNPPAPKPPAWVHEAEAREARPTPTAQPVAKPAETLEEGVDDEIDDDVDDDVEPSGGLH